MLAGLVEELELTEKYFYLCLGLIYFIFFLRIDLKHKAKAV